MENFKPATPSFMKRVFGNPLVQLCLFLVVAGGAGISVYRSSHNRNAHPEQSTSSLQVNSMPAGGNPQPQASADMPVAPVVENNQASLNADSAGREPAAAAVAPAAGLAAEKALASAEGANKDAVAKSGSPKIVIIYAEVNNPALKKIFEDSQETGQFVSFPDYAAGILPGIEKRINPSNLNIKVLAREERNVDATHPLRLFNGKNGLGLAIELEPMNLDNDTFNGNIQIHRSWIELGPNQAPETIRKTFPATFEITPGTGFFMSGVVPRKTPLDVDPDFTSMDIYKILRSPSFQKGDSEFVIFIEFDKGN
jgi:hypothetical protein